MNYHLITMRFLAQTAVGPGVDSEWSVSNLSTEDVVVILNRLASWMFSVFLIVAVLAILFAAFKYLTAGGRTEDVRSANRALFFAIIAIAIALISGSIPILVKSLIVR